MEVFQAENQRRDETNALITTKTYEFSDTSIHLPGTEVNTEYSGLDVLGNTYVLRVFANGYRRTKEGYVSVIFYSKYADILYTGCCIISVIDISEKQIFSRTITLGDEENREVGCFEYISRRMLLCNPEEFLPNDVLTLHIDVYATYQFTPRIDLGISCQEAIKNCFSFKMSDDGTYESVKFYLDSPLGARLAAESTYFRDISMVEEITNAIPVAEKEFKFFMYIGQVMMGDSPLEFQSIKEIFDLYIVADKYDIPTVIELCTLFLKLCLCNHTVDECLEIANRYEKEGLKKLLIDLINQVKTTNIDKEMIRESDGVHLTQPIHGRIWFYRRTLSSLNFEILEPPTPSISHNEEFDFYK